MNQQQQKQIRKNAQIIEKLSGKKKYANYVDSDVKNNFKIISKCSITFSLL